MGKNKSKIGFLSIILLGFNAIVGSGFSCFLMKQ